MLTLVVGSKDASALHISETILGDRKKGSKQICTQHNLQFIDYLPKGEAGEGGRSNDPSYSIWTCIQTFKFDGQNGGGATRVQRCDSNPMI
jgi:hypothetical protein